MADERKPPPRFRRPSELLDDEVVEIPERQGALPPQPFNKLVQTPAEMMREVLGAQRKMALQLDGFGQLMNTRFDIFHKELAMLRATVTESHEPRIEQVEKTLGQRVARGGGIVGIVLLALPMLAEALPKYRWLFDAISGAFQ